MIKKILGWQVEFPPAELLVCCPMGWGSGPDLELPLVAQAFVPKANRVRQCLRVLLGGSSSKGRPGGGDGRISPTRCVSSMLLCHPS